MPIPDLTPCGVLPVGQHDCTLDEIKAVYAVTDHRQALWADLQGFLAWAAPQPKPTSIYFDGSFTSDKTLPSDIDVVFDLEGCAEATLNHWIGVWYRQRDVIKQQYRVDLWLYFPGSGNDLRAFFAYVRPEEAILRGMNVGDLKGLLRVAP